MESPYIIVTNGPTGSGKTGLVNKVINYYKVDGTYRKFLIDDLIEENQGYKAAIDLLIEEECKSRTLCPNLRKRLENPDDDFYARFENMYFKYRGTTAEKWCGKDHDKTCNEFLDELLDASIKRGDNIVFETVGTYYTQWLVDKLHGRYHVYFAFTILDFCENVRRNKTRAATQMEAFILDRRNNAPRLPNVSELRLAKTLEQIRTNLWNMMGQKLAGNLPDVHHIIVFDNTTMDTSVIYDSDTSVTMVHVLLAMENVVNITRQFPCTRVESSSKK
jgi:hypothetical protein